MGSASLACGEKKARKEGRIILFLDETAFYLTPISTYSWSPRGHALRVGAQVGREHLSVIGALTLDGRLHLHIHRHACRTAEVIAFLCHLLHHIPGRMLVVWDGGSIHSSAELAEFLAMDTEGRVAFEPFPPYAPEVDPQEYVWRQLKYDDVINRTKYTLDQLEIYLRRAVHRLRRRVSLLRALVRHAGLEC